MASIVVGTLRVLLTSDSAQFEAGMRRVQQSFGDFSKSAQSIGRQATQLGASLTKTLTLPILGFGGAVAKAAMDFESSFAGVKKTVNATEAEFAVMAQSLRDLAKTIPVNVNELNRLAEAAGAMGIPKAEIVEFSRVMALLGVTTNVTSDQAAESIGKIQNIFASAGKETDRFAATLVALGNAGASFESQILEMATRIAATGNVIGLTQGQVLAFASALSDVGLEAEAGGTAISRVFVDIAASVSKGGKELAQFANVAGLSTAAFSKMFKEDAAGAVLAFIEGLGRIKASGGDVLGVLAAMGIEEVRLRNALLAAAGAGDKLRNALTLQGVAWRENSALTEEARKRFETTKSQLILLGTRVNDVAITLGNALLPMIKATVSVLDDLLPIIESVARMFVALPTPIQAVVVGLGLAVAAAGPLLFVFGQLAIAAGALSAAFATGGLVARAFAVSNGVLAVSVRVLTSSFGLLGLAIGAVWAAWKIGNTETVKNSIATWALSADNLTAKLFRLVAGVDKMSEAEARAAVQATAAAGAATASGVASDKHAQGLMASHGAVTAVTAALKAGEPALDKNLFQLKESAEAAREAAQAARELAEAQANNIAIALALTADSWAAKAAMMDFNGQRTMEELERQFKEQQDAARHNLDIRESDEKDSWTRRAAMFDSAGLAELERIDKHYQAVTVRSRASLQQVANEAWRNYESARAASGQFSKSAIRDLKDIAEAAQAAVTGQSRTWKELAQSLTRTWSTLETAIQGSFAQILLRTRTFKEAMIDIWQSIKGALVNIFADIAAAYIKQLARMAAVKWGMNLASGSVLGSVLGGGAAAATGGAIAGGTAAAGAAGATAAAGAGGAGATAAGVGGGIGLGTTVAITGGVAAGVLLAWAIWKQGLFRGGEELFVNKRRDKFQLQLGGPPVSVGGSVMAGTLASWGEGSLFTAMQRANKMRTYDAAQSAIVTSFAAHGGQQLKSFELGGFVPPGAVVPAVLHGGTHGEVVMSAEKMGTRVVNIYNTIQGVLDRDSVEAVWREHILPMEKRALILNTDDLTLFHRQVLV